MNIAKLFAISVFLFCCAVAAQDSGAKTAVKAKKRESTWVVKSHSVDDQACSPLQTRPSIEELALNRVKFHFRDGAKACSATGEGTIWCLCSTDSRVLTSPTFKSNGKNLCNFEETYFCFEQTKKTVHYRHSLAHEDMYVASKPEKEELHVDMTLDHNSTFGIIKIGEREKKFNITGELLELFMWKPICIRLVSNHKDCQPVLFIKGFSLVPAEDIKRAYDEIEENKEPIPLPSEFRVDMGTEDSGGYFSTTETTIYASVISVSSFLFVIAIFALAWLHLGRLFRYFTMPRKKKDLNAKTGRV